MVYLPFNDLHPRNFKKGVTPIIIHPPIYNNYEKSSKSPLFFLYKCRYYNDTCLKVRRCSIKYKIFKNAYKKMLKKKRTPTFSGKHSHIDEPPSKERLVSCFLF